MIVKKLIEELKKQDPDARIIVACDHDGNRWTSEMKVRAMTEENEGYDELSEYDQEQEWTKGDVELDIW